MESRSGDLDLQRGAPGDITNICSSRSPDPERVRPSHYGTSKKRHPTVARGPVPRTERRQRGTGPRTTGTGNRFLSIVRARQIPNGIKKTSPHRSAGACPPHRSTNARDRPSHYGNREPLSVVRARLSPKRDKKTPPPHRSAGACPPHCSTMARDRPSPYVRGSETETNPENRSRIYRIYTMNRRRGYT